MRLIDVEDYCKNYCLCNREKCSKDVCPLWKVPVVDAELVRHGKWEKALCRGEGAIWKCSECGNAIYTSSIREFPSYCLCGAKMEVGTSDGE